MNQFQFQTTANIIAGIGSIQQLATLLKDAQYTKILLVTDPGMLQHQLHTPILNIFTAISVEYTIYYANLNF